MRAEEEAGMSKGIEFRTNQHNERNEIKPDEKCDGTADGAIDLVVVGEVADVGSEEHGGDEPHHGTEYCAGKNLVPRLGAGQAVVIDEADDGDAGEGGDDPTHGRPHAEDVGTELVSGAEDHPGLDLV